MVCLSVCDCVALLMIVSPAKTDGPIEMPCIRWGTHRHYLVNSSQVTGSLC